jgi:hypothetical protein
MNTSEAALAMIALFLLRLAFPLIVIFIFGYGMNFLAQYLITDVKL